MTQTLTRDYGITYFYYPDIEKVAPFYEDILGFELVLDQGLAKIYRIGGSAYFGNVDGNRGHLRHQEKSAVLLTLVTDDVSGWHAKLTKAGVAGLSPLLRGRFCKHFFFEDPAGYAIEIQRFHDPDVAALFQ